MQRRVVSLHGIERGLAAPFVLLGCVFAVYASLEMSPVRWTASLLCLAMAWMFVRRSPVRSDSLVAVTVYGFCLCLVANNLLVNPSYSASAPFHAVILAAAFALGRRFEPATRDAVLIGVCGIVSGLALLGIWQVGWLGATRAHSVFLTPATLATVVNLTLLPTIAFALWGGRRILLTFNGALLVCCLLLTVSRGGLLGLCGGILAMSMLARMNGFPLGIRELSFLIAILAGGWAMAGLAELHMPDYSPVRAEHVGTPSQGGILGQGGPLGIDPGEPSIHSWFGDAPQASSVSRLELYLLAARALGDAPILGIGYMGFQALLETRRDLLPSFEGFETSFVHNDYLQILLELGALGMLLLLSAVALSGMRAAHASQRSRRRRLLDIALFSAVASMCTHALVDFPFYVSFCLLLFGFAVGLLDQSACESSANAATASAGSVRRFMGITISAAYLVLLLPPTIAEIAASRAHQAWRSGNAQSAAYWFEVARRFAPRDWRYHWSAGNFWYLQALELNSPVAAGLADAAFAAGARADPRNVRNLLGQIDTHRGLRHLLESPVDQSTMHAWLEKAIALAPMDPSVQAEVKRNRPGSLQ